ncbi:MAG: arsenite efflux transporter metallochaperone ArsD [Acidibrevibacterium sp.]|jgi:AhpD family alkylhydroperoxidase|uniref:arsenite efflux transporter metallochaperone ArsD n=1 Tax=Acidibrevibacterium sp. TaxID=2606776 RepID=UPI003D022885
MTAVTVYDPPMCCSTGVCGPEPDPNLARFAADLEWLKTQGVMVQRVNLAQEPARFVAEPAVKALLDETGGDDLPALVMNGRIVARGQYPARAELAKLAGVVTSNDAADYLASEAVRALIGIGAAVAAGCEPCLTFHHNAAKHLGLSAEQMRRAAEIGAEVRAAATKTVMATKDRLLGVPAQSGCCGGAAAARPTTGCC